MKTTLQNKGAVIFDMDGVIIDSEKLWKQAESEIFGALGVPVSEELSALTQSMTTGQATRFWFDRFPWKKYSLTEVEARVINRVTELIQLENCCMEGISEFIRALKLNGYKIGLATNSPFSIIPAVLKVAKLENQFDIICSAEHEQAGKPDPAIYKRAAAKLGLRPQDCIAIEDSYSGMMAAKTAGMAVVAFTNNQSHTSFDIADALLHSFNMETLDLFHPN